MPLVQLSRYSYLVDHEEFIKNCYKGTNYLTPKGTTVLDFSFKNDLFCINAPHIPKSKNKKAKKRKLPMTEEEVLEHKYHETVLPRLKGVMTEACHRIRDICSSCHKTSEHHTGHIQQCGKCSDIFKEYCFQQCKQKDDSLLISGEKKAHFHSMYIANRLIHFTGEKPRTICIDNSLYLLPKQCTFLLSNIENIEPLINVTAGNGGFDVIVIDPPWENKSAKRGKKYNWLSLGEISQIPIGRLASKDCLVFVWVTNKQKFHNFTKDEWFPQNDIIFETEWHWMKVTKSGEPVFDFSSSHKRPYETVIVGKLGSAINIPQMTLVSFPCKIHSHKPPLDELICKFVKKKSPKCLELFARNLKPNWTCCGNEVLQLQQMTNYILCEINHGHSKNWEV